MKISELESKAKAAPKAGLVLSPDLLLRVCAALRDLAEARNPGMYAGILARHGLELE